MIKILILFLLMLISMGFFLLIERKLMSLIQFRFGPNKVLFLGLFQFLIDMFKLLFKEYLILFYFKVNFFVCLILLLLISFIFWLMISFNYFNFNNFNYFIILMLFMLFKMLFLSLFLLMYKSIYVQISFIRVIVQFISYDIMIMLMFIFLMLLILSLGFELLFYIQKYFSLYNLNYYLLIIWLVSLMMEILRLPFDFYESESELISGFNLELGSFKFMLLFMMEYLDMVYFLNITVLFYLYNKLLFLNLLMLLMLILWIRTMIIRYRYDKMLNLMWKKMFFLLIMFIMIMLFILNI